MPNQRSQSERGHRDRDGKDSPEPSPGSGTSAPRPAPYQPKPNNTKAHDPSKEHKSVFEDLKSVQGVDISGLRQQIIDNLCIAWPTYSRDDIYIVIDEGHGRDSVVATACRKPKVLPMNGIVEFGGYRAGSSLAEAYMWLLKDTIDLLNEQKWSGGRA